MPKSAPSSRPNQRQNYKNPKNHKTLSPSHLMILPKNSEEKNAFFLKKNCQNSWWFRKKQYLCSRN